MLQKTVVTLGGKNQLKTTKGQLTGKRPVSNNTNGKTNINGNSTNKTSKGNQSWDNSRASLQDQTKQMQSSIKLGNNRPNATARKDDIPK